MLTTFWRIAIVLGFILSILLFVGGLIASTAPKEEGVKPQPAPIEMTGVKEGNLIMSIEDKEVYLYTPGGLVELPFCGLVSIDETKKDNGLCFDWTYWHGYAGISIINLTEKL